MNEPREPFPFRHPGTVIVPAQNARCRHCRGTEHLIHGEGFVVCRPCLMIAGSAAGFPSKASPERLDALAELHGDVVSLLRVATEDPDHQFVWEWTARWPGPMDFRLRDGGTA